MSGRKARPARSGPGAAVVAVGGVRAGGVVAELAAATGGHDSSRARDSRLRPAQLNRKGADRAEHRLEAGRLVVALEGATIPDDGLRRDPPLVAQHTQTARARDQTRSTAPASCWRGGTERHELTADPGLQRHLAVEIAANAALAGSHAGRIARRGAPVLTATVELAPRRAGIRIYLLTGTMLVLPAADVSGRPGERNGSSLNDRPPGPAIVHARFAMRSATSSYASRASGRAAHAIAQTSRPLWVGQQV
ncbi:MAG: hypothetical protein QOI71_3065 [Gaiellales bacterium]|nr:hypothetical protein [Gaiellales bacterium]